MNITKTNIQFINSDVLGIIIDKIINNESPKQSIKTLTNLFLTSLQMKNNLKLCNANGRLYAKLINEGIIINLDNHNLLNSHPFFALGRPINPFGNTDERMKAVFNAVFHSEGAIICTIEQDTTINSIFELSKKLSQDLNNDKAIIHLRSWDGESPTFNYDVIGKIPINKATYIFTKGVMDITEQLSTEDKLNYLANRGFEKQFPDLGAYLAMRTLMSIIIDKEIKAEHTLTNSLNANRIITAGVTTGIFNATCIADTLVPFTGSVSQASTYAAGVKTFVAK